MGLVRFHHQKGSEVSPKGALYMGPLEKMNVMFIKLGLYVCTTGLSSLHD